MKEILIVDDEPKFLALISEILTLHGYTTHLITSGDEALETIKNNPDRFQAIVLDWKLNCGMDGDMLIKMIRRYLPDFMTPIIFITHHTKISSKCLMRLGAYDTIAKPFASEQLIDTIERATKVKSEEDPHQNAPNNIDSKIFKKNQLAKKVIDALFSTDSLKEAAAKLQFSTRHLYRLIHKLRLHSVVISSIDQDSEKYIMKLQKSNGSNYEIKSYGPDRSKKSGLSQRGL